LEEAYATTRKKAELLNVINFKSKAKPTTEFVRDLLFAGDSVLVAHHSYAIQTIITKIVNAAKKLILEVTSRKLNAFISLQKFIVQISATRHNHQYRTPEKV